MNNDNITKQQQEATKEVTRLVTYVIKVNVSYHAP